MSKENKDSVVAVDESTSIEESSENSSLWHLEGVKIHRLVFTGPQKSKEWHDSRKYRITGSRAACVHGEGYNSIEKTADIICGRLIEPVTAAMQRGIDKEDEVRKRYEERNGVKVKEIGFAFMVDHPHIGVSPDGLVEDDGMIEIKCPNSLHSPTYYKLVKRLEEAKKGKDERWIIKGKYSKPSHIPPSHYTQMQMQMAIMERKWCDYVVASYSDGVEYQERIDFNEDYWEALLKDLTLFVNEWLCGHKYYVPEEFKHLIKKKKNGK